MDQVRNMTKRHRTKASLKAKRLSRHIKESLFGRGAIDGSFDSGDHAYADDYGFTNSKFTDQEMTREWQVSDQGIVYTIQMHVKREDADGKS